MSQESSYLKATPDVAESFEKRLNAEASRAEEAESSKIKAWRIAGASVSVAVMLAAAIMLMMPLHRAEPVVIRVDNASGVTDVMTENQDKTFKSNDLQDIYWVNKFLIAHETYNYYTIQQDYDLVGLLSSKSVADEYAAQFEGKEAKDRRLGSNFTEEISVLSINPRPEDGTAIARFAKFQISKSQKRSEVTPEYYQATIVYNYNYTGKMAVQDRMINPFGFQVTSYRADREAAPNANAVEKK